MPWHIARKEVLENLTTYRFAILTGMLTVLVVVSLIVSYGDYALRLENYVLNQPKPHTSNVMIPPTPVSIFAKGVDAHLGRLFYITSLWIEVQDVEQSVNRLFALFLVPDMLFVVKVMLSLVALLFSFDAITAEKEDGTLKLVLSGGTGRIALLFGKLLGRFTLVLVPFALLFSLAVVVVALLPDVQADADYWLRSAIFLAISGVYVFLFTALGILLSSLAHRGATALIFSCAAWVVLVFIVPQLGMTIASSVAGVPPSERVEMEHRLANVGAIYNRIHPPPHQEGSQTYREMVERIRDANGAIADAYRPKLNRLIGVSQSIIRLSPAGSLTFLLTDIAGTGLREELRYKDAVVLYASRNFELINDIRQGEMEDFRYRRAAVGEVIAGSAVTDVTLLVIVSVGIVALTMGRIARYDVR